MSNEGCNMNNNSNVSVEESNDSIASNSEVIPKPPRGHKRLRNPENWKRTQQKKKRLSGGVYKMRQGRTCLLYTSRCV